MIEAAFLGLANVIYLFLGMVAILAIVHLIPWGKK